LSGIDAADPPLPDMSDDKVLKPGGTALIKVLQGFGI
jgi:hypothetical protein